MGQVPSDNPHEFIVVNSAISVQVEGIEDCVDMLCGDLYSEIIDCFLNSLCLNS